MSAGSGGAVAGGVGTGGGPNEVVVGDTFAFTSAARLIVFKRASGAIERAVAVTGLASGEDVLGIDLRPANQKLYALASSAKLYTIDTTTGVATLASTLFADPADTTNPYTSLSGSAFGVDFTPVADRLRVVTSAGQNLRINVDTGAIMTDTVLTPATSTIDSTTNEPARRGGPDSVPSPNLGVLTTVGSLNVDSIGDVGFDIRGRA